MENEIRQKAYEKWEAEGRPEGQHERHWIEAKAELEGSSEDLTETLSSEHGGGVVPPSSAEENEHKPPKPDPEPETEPGSVMPGELASENK